MNQNDRPAEREGTRSKAPYSVLVVTDSDHDLELYDRINDEADIKVTICDSRTARLTLATSGPDVALFCSDCEEADVLATSRRLRPETPMMVIGESRDVDRVVDYIRNSACDFVGNHVPGQPGRPPVRRSPAGSVIGIESCAWSG